MLDYSQYGQALVLQQLVTKDTPRILVDIGAHDGICGSNSRALLEQGWQGLLVEPMPLVFAQLQANSQTLRTVKFANVACGDREGTAQIRVGKDGALGQTSSFSQETGIREYLSDDYLEVRTTTLARLLRDHELPEEFGVLLIDAEGWDLTILQGLPVAHAKPRIIVTEDFGSTNKEKYEFLKRQRYRFMGNCGGDSFWISESHPVEIESFDVPTFPLPQIWKPGGRSVGAGRAMFDENASFGYTLFGWAWNQMGVQPPLDPVLILRETGSDQRYFFRACRMPRPDVAAAFKSEYLLFSGFRARVDAPPAQYELGIIQETNDSYTEDSLGSISLPLKALGASG